MNTERVCLAKRRCRELGVEKVIIASETGRSALRALEVFRGEDVRILMFTHYPETTWGPRGEIPDRAHEEGVLQDKGEAVEGRSQDNPGHEVLRPSLEVPEVGLSHARGHNR
ncbi:MAG: hypothetical protein BA066_05015 [Candidatus Korarchaeota archaeon NZ13-K]|nr:MAG: hypothetical protein BA066_05015 [Candidatus Korarchaeota archaeon NZ13-K]